MVGAVRFELTTSCTRNKRATRLRYAPTREEKMTIGVGKCNPQFFTQERAKVLYSRGVPSNLQSSSLNHSSIMRSALFLAAVLGAVTLTGCAGPENKFGRGFNNMTEIVRGGEMRRPIEQTMLWDGASQAPVGFARGFTRTMARTGIGIYEVITFPIPPYEPLLVPKSHLYPDPSMRSRKYPWGGLELSEKPVFPDSYQPGFPAGPLFETDSSTGFAGGDAAPNIPGSKFHVH
jgi:putative exosortase-associated protein (TIGR04073 family)